MTEEDVAAAVLYADDDFGVELKQVYGF